MTQPRAVWYTTKSNTAELEFDIPKKETELIIKNEIGKDITTSLVIAEAVGKQHKNVLQDIRNLKCSEEYTRLNFQPSEYIDSTGRKLIMYHVTKVGFSYLLARYTGKKALKFKNDFIQAFNVNESLLNSDAYIVQRALEITARQVTPQFCGARL